MFLLLEIFDKDKEKKGYNDPVLPTLNINEEALVSKLLEGLKAVRIK